MTQHFLILGKEGQLGHAFERILTSRGASFAILGQADADLSKPAELTLELDAGTTVLNCAAYTNVDGAETDEDTARLVNGEAVGKLGELCREAGSVLVHYSTDYVFNGQGTSPYPIDAKREPLGAYGRTKALGEELLEASSAEHLLIRTSWVYAPWGNNFVRTMARLMGEKDRLKVVSDQRGRPTHVDTLALRSLALLERNQRGTFHVTDGGECSWFEFACAIRDAIASPCEIEPCTTAEFPRPARRPAYSVLDTHAADQLLGPAPHFRERLAEMAPGLLAAR